MTSSRMLCRCRLATHMDMCASTREAVDEEQCGMEVIDLTNENESCRSENEDINSWRKEINPFSKYGFLHGSSFHFLTRLNDCRVEGNLAAKSDDDSSANVVDKILPESNREDTLTGNEAQKRDVSYHVEFFDLIVSNVINRKIYHNFFTKEEQDHVNAYLRLQNQCKELYVRLFQRKRCWIREKNINYDGINSKTCIKELIDQGFLLDESNLTEVEDALTLLSAGEIKGLSSEFKMGKGCTSKGAIIDFLKNCCKKQRTIFGGVKSMEDVVLKRTKKILGLCVRINEVMETTYQRIIILFQMFSALPSDNLLYHLLQIKIGQIIYPKYEFEPGGISQILNSRDKFVELTTAMKLETDFNTYLEANKLEQCYTIFKQVHKLLKGSCHTVNDETKAYLHRHTSIWIYLRICRNSIIVMEKLKKYQEAVETIDFLLELPFIHAKHRGVLWERKIIDLERHLKLLGQALTANENAVADIMVRGHFYYTFKERLDKKRRKKNSSGSGKFELQYFKEVKIDNLKATSVLDTSSATRAVFLSPREGDSVMSNVEQYVLEYYKEKGFAGAHDEGSIISTIFVLLFWDIIFKPIPNTFHSEYQIAPLDFFNDEFYLNRKEDIDERLKFVYNATKEELQNEIYQSWEAHYGVHVIGANWSVFATKHDAVDVTLCIKPTVLGGVCEMLCKDFRTRRSGFPDLTLWNINENKCKIIEVKGPGDKLSSKQIVWLDILQFLGADVMVCHVTGIGSKRKFISIQDDT